MVMASRVTGQPVAALGAPLAGHDAGPAQVGQDRPEEAGRQALLAGQVLGRLRRPGRGQREQGPDAVVDLGRDVHGESLPAPGAQVTSVPGGRPCQDLRHGTDRAPHHRRRRGGRGPEPRPPGPADRDGARPAGADREGLLARRPTCPQRLGTRARSTPRRSPPWIPTSWRPSSRSGRPCTATPARWPAGCRPSAASWPTTTANKADNIWKGVPERRRAPRAGCAPCRASASRRPRSSPPCWASSWASARRAGARSPPPTARRGSYLSVADITDPESLAKVRATKKAMKAKAKARAGA